MNHYGVNKAFLFYDVRGKSSVLKSAFASYLYKLLHMFMHNTEHHITTTTLLGSTSMCKTSLET